MAADPLNEARVALHARWRAAVPLIAAARQANADYLAVGSPTNAQVVAQVRALTQQNQRVLAALDRLLRIVVWVDRGDVDLLTGYADADD